MIWHVNERDFFKNNFRYDRGSVMQISTVFGHVYHIACRSISETGLFRRLSDYVFGVRNFENTRSISFIFFFQNVENLIEILEIPQKTQKKTFFLR